MKYRKNVKTGEDLSVLGYGCLRFTKKGATIDQEKAEKEMIYATDNGVNYFDTAYIYPGSEVALGKLLAKGYRNKVYIATKLPHYFIKKTEDMEKFFQEQLQRLQTDYIDYYLMHMLSDTQVWQRLISLGIIDWIEEKKASGQIRRIGFSFHGGTQSFMELVDAYDWDFCQIQFNYLDEFNQAGIKGLRYAAEKNLPVIIMEPLRGGKLTHSLPPSARKIMQKFHPTKTPAEWALRWVWDHPEVTVVLSGMNQMEQVVENIRIASTAEANTLTEEEKNMIAQVKEEWNKNIQVPCTGCGYCMPCPHGVDIPVCFDALNTRYIDNWFVAFKKYVMCTTMKTVPSNASKCVRCRRCEKLCPQGIQIVSELDKVKKVLENIIYPVTKFFMKLGKF